MVPNDTLARAVASAKRHRGWRRSHHWTADPYVLPYRNAASQITGPPPDAGREYVAAYAAFMHYVEELQRLAAAQAHSPGHLPPR